MAEDLEEFEKELQQLVLDHLETCGCAWEWGPKDNGSSHGFLYSSYLDGGFTKDEVRSKLKKHLESFFNPAQPKNILRRNVRVGRATANPGVIQFSMRHHQVTGAENDKNN